MHSRWDAYRPLVARISQHALWGEGVSTPGGCLLPVGCLLLGGCLLCERGVCYLGVSATWGCLLLGGVSATRGCLLLGVSATGECLLWGWCLLPGGCIPACNGADTPLLRLRAVIKSALCIGNSLF